MSKKVLSYLLSLVIAFNFTSKKIDANFLSGILIGYFITRALQYKVDRSDCEKILQWQLDKCQKGLKEEQNIPIEETIARSDEMESRRLFLFTAAVGALSALYRYLSNYYPQEKQTDNVESINREGLKKNQSKSKEHEVDKQQKS